MVADNIDDIYLYLCEQLLKSSIVNKTKEITNAQVTLTNINNNLVSIRNMSKLYLLAELTWYFAGRTDTKFIGTFANTWRMITDDGKTNNSAYGYIIQYKHGFNQIKKVIELLRKDPTSRRALININTPNKNVIETKDEPCTIALQFLIRNNKLNCTAMMRSNDIWFGFPYDVAFFTELQKYIANQLNIDCGEYTHFATSLHAYEKDYNHINEVISKNKSIPIEIDWKNFYDNYKNISNQMDKVIEENGDVKKEFKKLINRLNIAEV